jgi:hypothetical protein
MSRVPDLTRETVRVEEFKSKLDRLSLVAEEFYTLMGETRELFDLTNSPARNKYVILIDEFVTKILGDHADDDKFFITEKAVSTITDVCQERLSRKILQPGYIWDSRITKNICRMLDNIPSDELQLDKTFLKTVSKLPPIHPVRAGPGTWFVIHTLAKSVKTYEEHMHVCDQLRDVMKHFYCPKCKQNFQVYLKENNPKTLLPSRSSNVFKAMVLVDPDQKKRSEPIMIPKLFIWTVDFHNAVNAHKDDYSGASTRLSMDILDAWNLYCDYHDEKFTPCASCVVK